MELYVFNYIVDAALTLEIHIWQTYWYSLFSFYKIVTTNTMSNKIHHSDTKGMQVFYIILTYNNMCYEL